MTTSWFGLLLVCVLLSVTKSCFGAENDATAVGVTGTLDHHPAFASSNVAPRNVDIWLPPSYRTNTGHRYPVIYAHDGQNQFDPRTSFIGVDWGLDEALIKLSESGRAPEAIVVAIWNTPKRTQEYLPAKMVLNTKGTEKHAKLLEDLGMAGKEVQDQDWLSDAYLLFITRELKPFVDHNYRTSTNRTDTITMGSSAGALISLYAICEYPEVFGASGCVSTHWPLGDGLMIDYIQNRLPDPATHRLYFDFGTETLDKGYEPYQRQMDRILKARGYREGVNWMTRKFEGHDHSERSWRKRVAVPLEFLLRPAEEPPRKNSPGE